MVVGYAGYEIWRLGLGAVLRSLPVNPLFYLLYLVHFAATPAAERLIYALSRQRAAGADGGAAAQAGDERGAHQLFGRGVVLPLGAAEAGRAGAGDRLHGEGQLDPVGAGAGGGDGGAGGLGDAAGRCWWCRSATIGARSWWRR
ncbi:hypothetical protein AB5I41_23225 [Sphingomonas sp. MMS24-JH45]